MDFGCLVCLFGGGCFLFCFNLANLACDKNQLVQIDWKNALQGPQSGSEFPFAPVGTHFSRSGRPRITACLVYLLSRQANLSPYLASLSLLYPVLTISKSLAVGTAPKLLSLCAFRMLVFLEWDFVMATFLV